MQETKGQATKNHILKEGLMLASVKGLVNISIGGLAAKAEMSRSGLFAHFLSKEQLQLEILDYANTLFEEIVMRPCRELSTASEQLRFLTEKMPFWFENTEPKIPGGCIFLTACLEFDDRPGKVRDMLLEQQRNFLSFLQGVHKKGVEEGTFTGIVSDEDFAFVFYSFYMGFHQYKKFFGNENAQAHIKKHFKGLIDYVRQPKPQATFG